MRFTLTWSTHQLIYPLQFGGQEPGSDADIGEFCMRNHGVTFPLMKKSDVNGSNANAVFKWLKNEKPGLLGLTRIKVCCV
jgi:peroxiredoxin